MLIFRPGESSKSVSIWGPIASLKVQLPALNLDDQSDDWVLAGVSVNAQEIVDVRQCFNETSYIYALGNDQGKCVINLTFAIFLGTKDCQGTDNFETLDKGLGAYAKGRISKNLEPTTITIGGFSAQGWMTGINVGQADPSNSVCYGDITFVVTLPNA